MVTKLSDLSRGDVEGCNPGGTPTLSTNATTQQTETPGNESDLKNGLNATVVNRSLRDCGAERELKPIIRKKKRQVNDTETSAVAEEVKITRTDRFDTGICWGQKAHKLSF